MELSNVMLVTAEFQPQAGCMQSFVTLDIDNLVSIEGIVIVIIYIYFFPLSPASTEGDCCKDL